METKGFLHLLFSKLILKNPSKLGQNGLNVFKHYLSTNIPVPFPVINKDTVYSAGLFDTHTVKGEILYIFK